ncbi:RFG1 [Sanghuangporus vaninii]
MPSSHTRASASSVQALSSSSRSRKDVPRPPNSFICFRSSKRWREVERGIEGNKAKGVASGKAWRNLSPEDRAFYIEMAEAKKREHNLLYPNYEYKPQRKARKKKSTKRDEHARTTEAALDVDNPGPSTSSISSSMIIDSSNNEVAVDAAGEEESDAPLVDPLLSASDKQSFGNSSYNPTSTSFTVQPATDFQGQFLAFVDQFSSSY